ncbi:unnamed protein product [Blepharisma stoltei]|uniref:Uncharacterized protein n=1 Tax=Blepharisma stoltei TaxID=1481888 RepID=A0AAU9IFH6_9CILI|nr:unnamed protein product [Blepharisma stoltei]
MVYDENKITIKINGWSMGSFIINGSVKFENVIFDGKEQYIACDHEEYCEYCAYNTYNETDGYYYSDRNEPISQNLPNDYCRTDQTTDQSLFK